MAGTSIDCVLCQLPFTLEDVRKKNFFLDSGVCYACYKKMFKLPSDISCFGKEYSPLAFECKQLCPDRKICPLFQSKEIKKLRKVAIAVVPRFTSITRRKHPFKKGSVIYTAFELCRKGCKLEDIERLAHRAGINPRRIFRVFRSGELYGCKWRWKQSERRCSIKYPKED